ncbi:hypothetical protein RJD24_20880 [Bacillaceae bacterium IKA-2]|nr:hypothetical protein RJD24_20880 [Bacillaceae bacterium IKA-2]
MNFIRFAETIETKSDKKVISVTVTLNITDATGKIYFTDIQAQEGDRLTGYTKNTKEMLLNFREEGMVSNPRHYNGIVRTGATIILLNTGKLSAGLDCRLYPIQSMEAGSIALSQGAGSHMVTFLDAASAENELALMASNRSCKKNGIPTLKDGFYQYTASGDSKHNIQLQERKSARVLFEFQETMEGGEYI